MRKAILVLLVVGCATPRSSEQKLAIIANDYRISGFVGDQPVDGTITFGETRYVFSSNFGSCSGNIDRHIPFSKPFVGFHCNGLSVRLTNNNGRFTDQAQVSMRQKVIVSHRRVCSLWGTDTDNKRVCRAYTTEPIEEWQTQRGSATVTTVASNR